MKGEGGDFGVKWERVATGFLLVDRMRQCASIDCAVANQSTSGGTAVVVRCTGNGTVPTNTSAGDVGAFRCSNNRTVPADRVNNCINDCGDNSDEGSTDGVGFV